MQKHLDIIRQQRPKEMRSQKKVSRRQRIILGTLGLLVVLGVFVTMGVQYFNSSAAFVQKDKYQAVFLNSSQVYFGRLEILSDSSYRLTDVFYIQQPASDAVAPGDQAAANPATQPDDTQPTLIKLGQELHGPEDEIIMKDTQVQFWENLKPDGKVSKAIESYKKDNS